MVTQFQMTRTALTNFQFLFRPWYEKQLSLECPTPFGWEGYRWKKRRRREENEVICGLIDPQVRVIDQTGERLRDVRRRCNERCGWEWRSLCLGGRASRSCWLAREPWVGENREEPWLSWSKSFFHDWDKRSIFPVWAFQLGTSKILFYIL